MSEQKLDSSTVLAVIRTHLANERTFAAWVRTGLSVDAAGIAVAKAQRASSTHWLALAFIVLGSCMVVFGGLRFGKVSNDLVTAGSPPVFITRHTVYAMVALLGSLVVCTFIVLA